MEKRLFVLLGICFLLATVSKAQQQPKTPIEMNNYMIGIINSVTQKGIAWGTMLAQIEESKEFGALTPFRVEIEKLLVSKSVELSTINDIGGSEDFRKAVIGFLKFETDMVHDVFIPYEKLGKDSKKRDLKRERKHLDAAIIKESEALQKVIKSQKEYADKNGFILEQK